jgi:hypothetical protein
VKYSASGAFQWVKNYGADDNGPHAAGVAVDSLGKIVITGVMTTGIDFGFGWVLGQGGSDAFVLKFDSNSTILWAKRGAPYGDRGTAIAIDRANNNILVSGDCGTGGLDFGTTNKILTSNTVNNSYFARFSP